MQDLADISWIFIVSLQTYWNSYLYIIEFMSAFPPTNLHLIGPHTCNNWLDDLVWIIRFVRLIVTCVGKSFWWIANCWTDEILIKLWQWNWQCSRKTAWWRWHCTFWSLWTGPLVFSLGPGLVSVWFPLMHWPIRSDNWS